MVDISIIIVSYNSFRDIVKALNVLESAEARPRVEVVIVDNASPDGSGSLLDSFCAGKIDVTVIQNSENAGFAQACNLAAQYARGRLLLLLNPDARITKPALHRALEIMGGDEGIGCLGPMLLDDAGAVTFSCRDRWGESYFIQRHLLPSRLADRLGRRATARLAATGGVVDVGWILGACIFVRRDLWCRLEGLDGRFFLSADDTADLCYRVRSLGYRAVFAPEVVAHHRGGSTWTNLRRFTGINVYNGHLLFAWKHLGRGAVVRLKALFFACSLLKIAASTLARILRLPVPKDAAAAHWEACKWLVRGKVGEIDRHMIAALSGGEHEQRGKQQ